MPSPRRRPISPGFYLIDSLVTGNFESFRAALSQLILPAVTLAVFSLAPITRMTRASMLAVLASEFIRTARASGLDGRTVILTYAFRNAMLPVVTTLGMVFSFLLGANVLVEKVFAWPGSSRVILTGVTASMLPLTKDRSDGRVDIAGNLDPEDKPVVLAGESRMDAGENSLVDMGANHFVVLHRAGNQFMKFAFADDPAVEDDPHPVDDHLRVLEDVRREENRFSHRPLRRG